MPFSSDVQVRLACWGPDVMAKRPNVNKVYEMFSLCVDPKHRGRGIATNLVKEALEVNVCIACSPFLFIIALKVAQKANCDAAITAATALGSKKVFQKLELQQFSFLAWDHVKVGGESYFDPAAMEIDGLTSYIKIFDRKE